MTAILHGREIVVDASAAVDYLLEGGKGPLEEAFRQEGTTLSAPVLFDLEVTAGLRRAIFREVLDPPRAEDAVEDLMGLPVQRFPHEILLFRVLELRDNFTPYDAAYVALAELLDARLMTADRPLATAVRRHTTIEVIDAS